MSLFSENIKHELMHPKSGEPTGLVLELLPGDHDDVFIATYDTVKAVNQTKAEDQNGALVIKQRINLMSKLIVGWEITSNIWHEVFKELGFSDGTFAAEKAAALLSKGNAGWIREQIDSAIAASQRDFKKASNS